MNRHAAWRAGLLVCALLVYGWNARSQTGDPRPTGHFVTFDPPGSTLTFPSAITAAGVVVGILHRLKRCAARLPAPR